MWFYLIILGVGLPSSIGMESDTKLMIRDYYSYKHVRHVCFISCESPKVNLEVAKLLMVEGIRVSAIPGGASSGLAGARAPRGGAGGVLLDAACEHTPRILDACSRSGDFLFDSMHAWLVVVGLNATGAGAGKGPSMDFIDQHFQHLNLSVDADVTVALSQGDHYELVDVFNFGKIQGNHLEKNTLGAWSHDSGLNISLEGFKYYNRWDFHNLTLRAISVILGRPEGFEPRLLEDPRPTPGVTAMTKIVAQLLAILREKHNFRFNYTIAGRWVGLPQRNSTLAVTNSLFWREQDISVTCLRIYPRWLDWVDPFLPPATQLQTKCYYLVPESGVGGYEDRFLTPLSRGVWACAGAACAVCACALAAAAAAQRHPQPAMYAACSVLAAVCQQAYEDGIQLLENKISSQSRRITLLVVGVTSMLLYNYYTSSVVSWLLSAAPPTLANLDALIRSDFELVFEDIGYTRQWLDGLGYYYSGFMNPEEDILRDVKVTNAKRTVPLLQPVSQGIELIRRGAYAYHTEPYAASQEIGRRLTERELCLLGALQVMPPSHVYVMGQKRSPYKQFFTWSLLRLLERGHTSASRARVGGGVPACSGLVPRALALGQAAPAFALLLQAYCLALVVLLLEIIHHRVYKARR